MNTTDLKKSPSTVTILAASLIGTAIEFFDFYIYATAAVLVFPALFFPHSDPAVGTLESLATLGLAFVARPLGAILFGHIGDRIGRKSTLVISLSLMGTATVLIGLLPSYATIGIWAPILLAIFRCFQGIGLGGEWGGAILLSTENAPKGKRAWYGMFPQLGAPVGLFLSTIIFLVLMNVMSLEAWMSYGWRIPFVASSVLLFVGLYIRLRLTETPAFMQMKKEKQVISFPLGAIFTTYLGSFIKASFIGLCIFTLFYISTVFSLSWGTAHLGYARSNFLAVQIVATVVFAITIMLSSYWSDKVGRKRTAVVGLILVFIFSFALAPLLNSRSAIGMGSFLLISFALLGTLYGPMGAQIAEQFPTHVRYTGASLAFGVAGILGGSIAPYFSTWLASSYGLHMVGVYVAATAIISLVAVLLGGETHEDQWHDSLKR